MVTEIVFQRYLIKAVIRKYDLSNYPEAGVISVSVFFLFCFFAFKRLLWVSFIYYLILWSKEKNLIVLQILILNCSKYNNSAEPPPPQQTLLAHGQHV